MAGVSPEPVSYFCDQRVLLKALAALRTVLHKREWRLSPSAENSAGGRNGGEISPYSG